MAKQNQVTRRDFLRHGAAAAGMVSAGLGAAPLARAANRAANRPNMLFILCDQLSLDAISAHGAKHVSTPNLDRLVRGGMSFQESYSTNPVCSPARSSLMTGRMPVETGVVVNGCPIHPDVPNIGQWLRDAGYDAVHCGKWHLPYGYPHRIDGFEVLPLGGAQGDILDPLVARSCEAYLHNRSKDKPFFMVASFMQPHDICYWALHSDLLVPEQLPFPSLAGQLPPLPPNLRSHPEAPALVRGHANLPGLSEEQWAYYNYIYNRQVEMLDADVGRLLDALEASGHAGDTMVIFSSDHGECRGRHEKVGKWTPYEESAKVPFLVYWPGHVREGARDAEHLVSGLDLVPTLCDYAGAPAPPRMHGKSLRPLLEGNNTEWHEYLVYETRVVGRTVRADSLKYVTYENDPVVQLFDLAADPWEMNNLAGDADRAGDIRAMEALLGEWRERMGPRVRTAPAGYWQAMPA